MSGRKLGGGRILGSGKSLLPPAPPAHQRTSDVISPAESVVSGDSRASTASPLATSPLPDNSQDLRSVVSLQNGGPSAVTAASTRLFCPICNEEMVSLFRRIWSMPANTSQLTLLQLNRYFYLVEFSLKANICQSSRR